MGLRCGNDGVGSDLVVLHLLGARFLQQALPPESEPKQPALDVYFSRGGSRRHCRWMAFLRSVAPWLDTQCRAENELLDLWPLCRAGIRRATRSELHHRGRSG